MRFRGSTWFRRVVAGHYAPAVHLVPTPLWGVNLRAKLSASSWKSLRARLLAERGLRCETCGAVEEARKIHAHEEWSYHASQATAVARVTSVQLVCAKCHAVEHFGRLTLLAARGQLAASVLDDVIAHFCRVNDATPADFDDAEAAAVTTWRRLSAISEWRVEWGPFAG